MKRTYIITLLLSLCSLFTYAQDSFFDKFADMDGVTSVYISKAMLSLMPDMKTEGVNIGEVASKLDNIQILSCEKPDIIAKLKKETAFISPKNGYEELMRINDEGEKTIIYLKRNKNKEKEFVLMSQEKPDIIAKLKKETAFISPKNGYEELMRINDEGEKTIIYLKRNKNKEKEFVLMSQEKNEFTIIAITGNLTLQEIQGIINKE